MLCRKRLRCSSLQAGLGAGGGQALWSRSARLDIGRLVGGCVDGTGGVSSKPASVSLLFLKLVNASQVF